MFYGEKIALIEDGGHIIKGYSFDDIERKMASAGLLVSYYPGYCIFVIAKRNKL